MMKLYLLQHAAYISETCHRRTVFAFDSALSTQYSVLEFDL